MEALLVQIRWFFRGLQLSLVVDICVDIARQFVFDSSENHEIQLLGVVNPLSR